MKFGRADLFSILKDVKRQGKRIKLKRRWLLGLPITKRERKKLKENRNRYLPELLRKDDMFYESVRTHVERAFGAHHIERVNSIPHDDKDLNRIPDSKRLILSCLDNLTTKGLYLLAMIVSGVTAKYERTRGCCSQGFLKARIFRRCNTVLQTRGYDFPNNIVLVILCIRAAIKTQQRSQNQKISGVSQAGSGGGSLNIRRNTHGILNAVSWGILMPLGDVIARYLKVFKSADPAWFYLHVSCQTAAYIVGVAGWGTSLKLGSDSAGITYSTHVDHQTIDYCREYLFNPQRLVSFSTIQVII